MVFIMRPIALCNTIFLFFFLWGGGGGGRGSVLFTLVILFTEGSVLFTLVIFENFA